MNDCSPQSNDRTTLRPDQTLLRLPAVSSLRNVEDESLMEPGHCDSQLTEVVPEWCVCNKLKCAPEGDSQPKNDV